MDHPEEPSGEPHAQSDHKPMTPPTSEEGDKRRPETSHSELSDLDLDDDDTEIEPDHYYDGGKIPVFKPTMDQFRSFEKFMAKIDHYGMRSGIVKVVPPKEWTDSLPALDESIKNIKINRPITQEFSGCAGIHGTFTQANIEKQRSYNLPQWKSLTEEPQHQPPARRGERRRNFEKANKPSPAKPQPSPARSRDGSEAPTKKRKGRPPKNQTTAASAAKGHQPEGEEEDAGRPPPTPTSPNTQPALATKAKSKRGSTSKPKGNGGGGGGGGATTVAERRKYNQQMTADDVDEEAFKDFDYRFPEKDEFTQQRCEELETAYWKSLTYAPPMYGADMPGSLFNEDCSSWNVAKLPNLLDVLGTKVPGVNTAYLYLGMWKATYAWHLEDVDLYSINYIHFGAPKQWYSISQEDARKFEAAMRDVWPNDAKHCSQFLRHKTYLISPSLLKSKYNITVNKLVHNEGEFVITFPYGYHSGYNLGYNCAESVNFATEAWLDYGRIAKKCDCEADSVWVDVGEIERKLRGEPTPEYYEETDEEGEFDEEGDAAVAATPLTASGKPKGRPRKSAAAKGGAPMANKKKIKIKIKKTTHEPCVLCPNDDASQALLGTDSGQQAHELCAQYTKETSIQSDESGIRTVEGIKGLPKERLGLKCSFCRNKKGACFQCSEAKCVRAFHATCAAAAGVRVEFGRTPVYYAEDGTEYYQEQYDFRCRFHRTKRAKLATRGPNGRAPASMSEVLEGKTSKTVEAMVKKSAIGDMLQAQVETGDTFAGTLIEKRMSESTVVLKVLPDGDEVEVELKWIWAPALEEWKQLQASPNAKPLPAELLEQLGQPGGQGGRGPPRPGDLFTEKYVVEEFDCRPIPKNPAQAKVNLGLDYQLWYYLPRSSTDTKAHYTHDLAIRRHNPRSDLPTPTKPPPSSRASSSTFQPSARGPHPLPNSSSLAKAAGQQLTSQSRPPLRPGSVNHAASNSHDPSAKMQAMTPVSLHSPSPLPNFHAPLSGQPWSAQAPGGSRPPSFSPAPYANVGVNKFDFNTPNSVQRRPSDASHAGSPALHRRQSSSSKSSAGNVSGGKPDEPKLTVSIPQVDMIKSLCGPPEDPQWRQHLERLSPYPFLKNALMKRPASYRSPYPSSTDDGPAFSEEYAAKLGIDVPQYKRSPPRQSRSASQSSGAQAFPNHFHRPGNPKPQNFFPFSNNTQAYQSPSPKFSAPPPLHKHSSSASSANFALPPLAKPIKRESFGAMTGVQPSNGIFTQFDPRPMSRGFPAGTTQRSPAQAPSNAMSPTMMAHGDVSLPQMTDLP